MMTVQTPEQYLNTLNACIRTDKRDIDILEAMYHIASAFIATGVDLPPEYFPENLLERVCKARDIISVS